MSRRVKDMSTFEEQKQDFFEQAFSSIIQINGQKRERLFKRHLQIEYNSIIYSDMQYAARIINKYTKIKKLTLIFNPRHTYEMEENALIKTGNTLQNCSNFSELNLVFNNTYFLADEISGFLKLTNSFVSLKKLSIEFNQTVKNDCLLEFFKDTLPTLKFLKSFGIQFGFSQFQFDDFLPSLTHLSKLEDLQGLNLGINHHRMSRENFEQLKVILTPLKYLKTLSLSIYQIQFDRKVGQLYSQLVSNSPHLEILNLSIKYSYQQDQQQSLIEEDKHYQITELNNLKELNVDIFADNYFSNTQETNHYVNNFGYCLLENSLSIQHLSIDYENCSNSWKEIICKFVGKFKQIKELRFITQYNIIDKNCYFHLANNLSTLPHLQTLNLTIKEHEEQTIPSKFPLIFSSCQQIKTLQLNLFNQQLPQSEIETLLAEISKCKSLCRLELKLSFDFFIIKDYTSLIKKFRLIKNLSILAFDFRKSSDEIVDTTSDSDYRVFELCGFAIQAYQNGKQVEKEKRTQFSKLLSNGYKFKKNPKLVSLFVYF